MCCLFVSPPAGELFAQAPVKEYPGIAVETVSDSSRYFVLRIQDDNGEDANVMKMMFSVPITQNYLLWLFCFENDLRASVL